MMKMVYVEYQCSRDSSIFEQVRHNEIHTEMKGQHKFPRSCTVHASCNVYCISGMGNLSHTRHVKHAPGEMGKRVSPE